MVDTDELGAGRSGEPGLVFDNGRVELLYTRHSLRMLTATTTAGPWDVAEETDGGPLGGAAEHVRSGAVQLLSRVRFDACEARPAWSSSTPSRHRPDGYEFPARAAPGLATWGRGFDCGWTYGDPPAWRGRRRRIRAGMRWMGSGETYREPGDPRRPCDGDPVPARTGVLRSPRFTLQGDSLWFRVMGAASPDSAALRLIDACTGQELARRTGPGSSALTEFAWSNTGRRGWPVHLELIDLLTRPGGVIGADAIRDSTAGAFSPPTPVAINQTAPAGGETLTPGQSYVVRWTSFSTAGVDSHVVYVSYDDFATPPIRLQRRNGNQFSWTWTVPRVHRVRRPHPRRRLREERRARLRHVTAVRDRRDDRCAAAGRGRGGAGHRARRARQPRPRARARVERPARARRPPRTDRRARPSRAHARGRAPRRRGRPRAGDLGRRRRRRAPRCRPGSISPP